MTWERIEARLGLRLTERERTLMPDVDPDGPGDPVKIGIWLANAPADDAVVCAARLAFQLREERAAIRQAGLDVHGGDTAYWRAAAERSRVQSHNFVPRQPTRCDACHDRLNATTRDGGLAA